jgi:hypothetical protein
LLADRIHKYHAVALSDQITNALANWEKDRAETLESFIGLLPLRPATPPSASSPPASDAAG